MTHTSILSSQLQIITSNPTRGLLRQPLEPMQSPELEDLSISADQSCQESVQFLHKFC
jgi:hypothetical protein